MGGNARHGIIRGPHPPETAPTGLQKLKDTYSRGARGPLTTRTPPGQGNGAPAGHAEVRGRGLGMSAVGSRLTELVFGRFRHQIHAQGVPATMSDLRRVRGHGSHVSHSVTKFGLIVERRTHDQVTREPMEFLSLAHWTGIVETELFVATYRSYGLATVRYPVSVIEGNGFSLRVLRAGKPRVVQFGGSEHAESLKSELALPIISERPMGRQ